MTFTSQPRYRALLLVPFLLLLAMAIAFAPTASAQSKAPNRIVALTPFSANTMAYLGVKPAAVGQTLGGDKRLAPVLRTSKVLKLSHPNGPNLEQLINQRAQLVFTSSQWRKGTQSMRNLGMRVVETEPRTIGQVYAQTRRIAEIINRKARGNRFLSQMKRETRQATAAISKRPKVLLLLGVGQTPFTFLENSWGGQIMKAAGGRMITGGASSSGGFARISDEEVLVANPDVIVAVPHANTRDIPKLIDFMKNNPAWESTPAARKDQIYVSTDNSMLQAGTDVARTIRVVRKQYLRNWK